MSFLSRLRNFVLSLTAPPLAAMPAAEPPPPAADPSSTQSMGPALRELFLTTTAANAGICPSAEFPLVYGVSVDFFVDEHVATVIALGDGSASVYTTSSFGVIGGYGHASVRKAARRFVTLAARHVDEAVPVATHPYPAAGNAFTF